ncbi:MAG: hypothetical protein ABS68_05170 [Niastella sp. SCN 39-18]|nr:MAG: hypothetical protein ABS68_05170 [Niastella sp. SCN 39-18]OJW09270.1 MAG: hypothetical protein BGO53_02295 [Sphingobacteriales bacterium 39-19]
MKSRQSLAFLLHPESGCLISFISIATGIFLSPPAAGFIICLIFYFFCHPFSPTLAMNLVPLRHGS